MSITLAELARELGLDYQGKGSRGLSRVSGWDEAGPDSLIYCDSPSKAEALPDELPAGAVVAPRDAIRTGWPAVFSSQAKLDFARAAHLICPPPVGAGSRHPSAVVSSSASIGDRVDIGPNVTVEAHAVVGEGTILHPGVVIGAGSRIGADCTLHPRVVLYPGVQLGDRVVLHAGVVVGSDGFGYVFDGQKQVKFPQAGQVRLDDDVEIGANTTIDRGSLGTTRIGRGTKIDNLVQVAHNVEIGEAVVIAAQTGISGSTSIGDGAVIGGQVGFGDHARVQGGAIIGSKAGVLPGKIVRGGEIYWGVPIRPLAEYKKLNALFGRLPKMKAELERLRDEVATLKEGRRAAGDE
jgi:UDP-3-O-[3-hydroxymyristoyl] glucosamine N-acyltransferase